MTPTFSRRLAGSCLGLCVVACAGASALANANLEGTSVAATDLGSSLGAGTTVTGRVPLGDRSPAV